MSYRDDLIRHYYSYHYKRFTPTTVEGWKWVLDRIHLNFGDILISLPRDSRILDVGCGVGYTEHYLLEKGFYKIDAIDLSEEQIQVAKNKLKQFGLSYEGKVNFYVVDALHYLKQAKDYDVILMIDFLEHFKKEDVIELLRSTHRALRKGGFLLLRTINADNPLFARYFYHDFTHETPFTPDSLTQCLTSVGFKIIKLAYEKVPQKMGFIYRLKLNILAKMLDIPPDAFSENLVAVATKIHT